MPNYRLLPPISVARQTMTFPGNGGAPRSLSALPGEFLDVGPADAVALESNGFLNVGLVGGTANRPPLAGTVSADVFAQFGATPGRTYLDTDIGAFIAFDGAVWRNPLTGLEA